MYELFLGAAHDASAMTPAPYQYHYSSLLMDPGWNGSCFLEDAMDLKRSLEAGDFVVIAEMEPPKGVDISTMVSNAAKVKE